jgi:hypothetical protein
MVDWQVSLLVHDLYAPAVSKGLIAEQYQAWRILEEQRVVSGRPHLEIESLVALGRRTVQSRS